MASLGHLSDFRPHPVVSLGVALAQLQHDLDQAEIERQRLLDTLPSLMTTPFGPAVLDELLTEAETVQRYDHDEDVWGGDDGSPT